MTCVKHKGGFFCSDIPYVLIRVSMTIHSCYFVYLFFYVILVKPTYYIVCLVLAWLVLFWFGPAHNTCTRVYNCDIAGVAIAVKCITYTKLECVYEQTNMHSYIYVGGVS